MTALDRFLDSVLTASTPSTTPWAVGTIATVTAGAATDGNALVVVDYQGAQVRAAYGAHYTPVVGHRVLMARVGPQLAIICRLIGTPPTT